MVNLRQSDHINLRITLSVITFSGFNYVHMETESFLQSSSADIMLLTLGFPA